MRSLAWLFTAGEAALYFVRVDECFGTVGGGGAEGNKSGVGRAGWREARVRASRSSCQPLGPAPGRERPGRPGPQTVISAPGQTASNPTRRQHPVLRCEDPDRRAFAFSCQSPQDSRDHCDWQDIKAQV